MDSKQKIKRYAPLIALLLVIPCMAFFEGKEEAIRKVTEEKGREMYIQLVSEIYQDNFRKQFHFVSEEDRNKAITQLARDLWRNANSQSNEVLRQKRNAQLEREVIQKLKEQNVPLYSI